MSKHRKSWSLSEKTNIVSYYQQEGIAAACRQFDVSSSMIYRWEKQLLAGKQLLANARLATIKSEISLDEYNRLLRENQALKELVAEKELALKIKDELLKKTILHSRTG